MKTEQQKTLLYEASNAKINVSSLKTVELFIAELDNKVKKLSKAYKKEQKKNIQLTQDYLTLKEKNKKAHDKIANALIKLKNIDKLSSEN